jgi:hypothetical protein
LFAEDSKSKNSISNCLGCESLQAPVRLDEIVNLAKRLFQRKELDFNPQKYDITMLTTDTGDASSSKKLRPIQYVT